MNFTVQQQLNTEQQKQQLDIENEVAQLRQFDGPPADFWLRLLNVLGRYFSASSTLLLVRAKQQDWQVVGTWPSQTPTIDGRKNIQLLSHMADNTQGFKLLENSQPVKGDMKNGRLLAGQLDVPEGQPATVLFFLLDEKLELTQLEKIFPLLNDIPKQYLANRLLSRSNNESHHVIRAIDLMVVLNEANHFMHSAMALCDELVSSLPCDRVSLGWVKGPYVHTLAISHIEKLNRKMEIVQALELVMEEAQDQDAEIIYPEPTGSLVIAHEHQRYAKTYQLQSLVSIPLRLHDQVVAVITCERNESTFDQGEVLGLRILCDQAVYRLNTLKQQDRWFGARLRDQIGSAFKTIFGVKYTAVKLGTLVFAGLLSYLTFASWDYRVEAPFILRTDSLTFIPAPFEGYVKEVFVQVGDKVALGDLMLNLDMTDLLMQKTEIYADFSRYAREEKKMRSKNALADMKIAEAMKDQMKAKLDKVHYNLARANILAMSAGVVVEGELDKMLGTPVKKGEVLFKVAALDKLYIELAVEERDVHQVDTQTNGEVSFLSQPQIKFPISVQRINPAAEVKDGNNVFVVRAEIQQPAPAWWRPGMSGIAKLDIEQRSPLWILSHRTVAYLRMFFWW